MEPRVELRLSELLKERGMSIRELGRITGVRLGSICGLCNNKPGTRLPLDNLARICVALNVDVSDVLVLRVEHSENN